MHAFQGRTVGTVIAAIEANHPQLTTQKSFYVEISRARHRAELVTDNREELGEHLEAATGERDAALEGAAAANDGDASTKPQREPVVQPARELKVELEI